MKDFTLRAAIIGAILSIIVAMYSAYMGLKIGGVYWPIITATIMSMGILKTLGGTNMHEINVAQTAASAGGLLAAGIIFTIPGIWLLGLEVTLWQIFALCVIAGLLGVLFSVPLRRSMIVKEKLPYPDGTACASVLKTGDEGGRRVKLLLLTFSIAGLFTVLRDRFALIPGVINLDTLKLKLANTLSFGSAISLVAPAGGYLIGPVYTSAWFLGSITSYLVLAPLLLYFGLFETKTEAIFLFTKQLGIGCIVGSAVTYFLLKVVPSLKKMFHEFELEFPKKVFFSLSLLGIIILSLITGMSIIVTVIAVTGAFVMAYVGARVTGEINIDPMEVFAMAVLLGTIAVIKVGTIPAFFLAAVVCIAAGIAGDMMQDLKAGYLVGTNPRAQTKAQIVGVLSASLVIGLTILALDKAYVIGSMDLPAPQAIAFKTILGGEMNTEAFMYGAGIGVALTMILLFLKTGFLSMAYGIGLYAPIELGFPLFLGGMIRYMVEKTRRKRVEEGRILAAGLIGGEGFIGVLLAVIPVILALL